MSRSKQATIPTSAPKAYRRIEAAADEAMSAWASGQVDAEIVALRDLATEVEQMQQRAVTRARSAGLSWSEVAALLGVTKQAAHKHYAVNDR